MKRSSFLFAFVFFIVLNWLILPALAISFDKYDYPYRSWTWWIVQHLRSMPEKFDIALVGSSLLLGSLNQCDADFAEKNIDATTHHRSLYLDARLHSIFAQDYLTFNAATPGQVPSDSYLLTKTMLLFKQHPRLIIYGFAPRDFLDSRLLSPADTEPFRYLTRFIPTDEIAPEIYGLKLASVDRLLHNLIYLYGNALDIQMCFNKILDSNLQWLVAAQPAVSYTKRLELLPSYKAVELVPGGMLSTPSHGKVSGAWKRDNLDDYRERYRRPNSQSEARQISFLKRLISLCQANKINLLLVNMPLSQMNIDLLGKDRYNHLVGTIASICRDYETSFIDIGSETKFGNELFEDSAHLSGKGARQFIDLLTEKIGADRVLAKVLASKSDMSKDENCKSEKRDLRFKPTLAISSGSRSQ